MVLQQSFQPGGRLGCQLRRRHNWTFKGKYRTVLYIGKSWFTFIKSDIFCYIWFMHILSLYRRKKVVLKCSSRKICPVLGCFYVHNVERGKIEIHIPGEGCHCGILKVIYCNWPHLKPGNFYVFEVSQILKVPSGQIGSKWEWYHWKAL